MPCYSFKIGNATGFICMGGPRRKACVHCGRLSDKLCDFPLSGAKAGQTCDRPICTHCATHIPPDTDYCRQHAEMGTTPEKQKRLAL
jgi:RNA polymerase subunit RPABC4/transcription elongation factor Spt4